MLECHNRVQDFDAVAAIHRLLQTSSDSSKALIDVDSDRSIFHHDEQEEHARLSLSCLMLAPSLGKGHFEILMASWVHKCMKGEVE